jgi:ADP-ribose pyrophosphatase YjhB (NUDIX family)
VTPSASAAGDPLVRQLEAHVPADETEAGALRRIRRLLTWLRAPLDEHADPTHVTGSAIVRDDDGRVLLHRHKRLGIWLQPGGHLEAGEQPWDAAVRETREETGVEASHLDERPCLVHVDVHEGPRGHVHLDLRYLLRADGRAPFAPAPGESRAVDWFTAALDPRMADASLRAAVAAAGVR